MQIVHVELDRLQREAPVCESELRILKEVTKKEVEELGLRVKELENGLVILNAVKDKVLGKFMQSQ